MPTTVGTPIFSVIVHKNQLKLMGLIHAMRNNGPLPQVFKNTVDDLILRSNVHMCHTSIPADEKRQKKEQRGCINKHGNCKAQFPRKTFDETEVDSNTGALNINLVEWAIALHGMYKLVLILFQFKTEVLAHSGLCAM